MLMTLFVFCDLCELCGRHWRAGMTFVNFVARIIPARASQLSVQPPVLDGPWGVVCPDAFLAFNVGDGARDAEDLVVCASRQAHLRHRLLQQQLGAEPVGRGGEAAEAGEGDFGDDDVRTRGRYGRLPVKSHNEAGGPKGPPAVAAFDLNVWLLPPAADQRQGAEGQQ